MVYVFSLLISILSDIKTSIPKFGTVRNLEDRRKDIYELNKK